MLAVDGCRDKVRLRRLGRIRRHAVAFARRCAAGVTLAVSTFFSRINFDFTGRAVAFAFCEVRTGRRNAGTICKA